MAQNLLFNATDLLEVIHPAYDAIRCVGEAVSYGRRCRNPINIKNRRSAETILRELPPSANDQQALEGLLQRLAGILCCRRNHQDQADAVAEAWARIIQAEVQRLDRNDVDRPQAERPPDLANREINALREEVEQLRQERAILQRRVRQSAAMARPPTEPGPSQNRRRARSAPASGHSATDDSPSSRPEPLADNPHQRGSGDEQEEPEGQEQQGSVGDATTPSTLEEVPILAESTQAVDDPEDTSQQQEPLLEEESRQSANELENAPPQQQETPLEAETRQAIERQEEAFLQAQLGEVHSQHHQDDPRLWEDAWARYERDWHNLSLIDTSTLDESIRESIPWPVREGRWQDVNAENISAFLRHAPGDRVRTIRDQARRWEVDAVGRILPGLLEDEEVVDLVELVGAVIAREIAIGVGAGGGVEG